MVIVGRADLLARREAILAELGVTGEQLRQSAEDRELTAPEWTALEQLDEIDFLLDETAS